MFSFVGPSDADVVHFRVVTQSDDAGGVDAVFADSPVPVGAGGGSFAAGGVALVGCFPVQGTVWSDGVVVAAERVELLLESVESRRGWLVA